MPLVLPPPARSTASPTRIWSALAVVYVVWGSTYLAIRVAVDTLPPFSLAAVRFLIAAAPSSRLTAARGDWRAEPIGLPQWRAAAIVGAALLLGGNGAVVWAERRIPSGVAALLVAMLPLWVALLERLLFGRRLARRAVIGLGLGFAGVAMLLGRAEAGGVDLLGAACLGGVGVVGIGIDLCPHGDPAPAAPRRDEHGDAGGRRVPRPRGCHRAS